MSKKCKKCRTIVYGSRCSNCSSSDFVDTLTGMAIGSLISGIFDSSSSSSSDSSSYDSGSSYDSIGGGGDFGGAGSGGDW